MRRAQERRERARRGRSAVEDACLLLGRARWVGLNLPEVPPESRVLTVCTQPEQIKPQNTGERENYFVS